MPAADNPLSSSRATLTEAEYRLLWETSTDAVVILDRASRIRYANPAVSDIFGYRPEEMIGEHIEIIQPERLRELHRRGLERYLATGVKRLNWRATEAFGLHRHGHEFPIEIAFSHLSHTQGDLFAAFIRDISDRKQAEDTRLQAERQYRAVVETATDAVITIDASSTIRLVNPAVTQIFGYEPGVVRPPVGAPSIGAWTGAVEGSATV